MRNGLASKLDPYSLRRMDQTHKRVTFRGNPIFVIGDPMKKGLMGRKNLHE